MWPFKCHLDIFTPRHFKNLTSLTLVTIVVKFVHEVSRFHSYSSHAAFRWSITTVRLTSGCSGPALSIIFEPKVTKTKEKYKFLLSIFSREFSQDGTETMLVLKQQMFCVCKLSQLFFVNISCYLETSAVNRKVSGDW